MTNDIKLSVEKVAAVEPQLQGEEDAATESQEQVKSPVRKRWLVLGAVLATAGIVAGSVIATADGRALTGSSVPPLSLVTPTNSFQQFTCPGTPPALVASDYELPAGLPTDPPGPYLSIYFATLSSLIPEITKYETPIALRATSLYDAAIWNCVASYSASYKDVLTGTDPVVSNIPASLSGVDLHTTQARILCMANAVSILLETLSPGSRDALDGTYNALGLGSQVINQLPPEVDKCVSGAPSTADTKTCLEAIATCHNYHPSYVGASIARLVVEFAKNDGFNMDGSIGINGTPCTANCAPFSDYTGYKPVNNGGFFSFFTWKRWRPLLEDNGLGFFVRQQHVTPHIGFNALPRVLTRSQINARTIPSPSYGNYVKETKLVEERLRNLDDQDKMEIEFFDNKIAVALAIANTLGAKYGPAMTFEHFANFFAGYTAGEYDSVILAWKEKVAYDRVRPTTILQNPSTNGGRKILNTWAGPLAGVKDIDAKDFQPYIRVMPHAEYPSGSGCICQTAAEHTDAWRSFFFNDQTDMPVTLSFEAGSSKTEPGVVPQNPLTINLTNMEHLRDVCGQSRLNGGMHFTDSVAQSYALCQGVGLSSAELSKLLTNNMPL